MLFIKSNGIFDTSTFLGWEAPLAFPRHPSKWRTSSGARRSSLVCGASVKPWV
jgi:hypothetical protein